MLAQGRNRTALSKDNGTPTKAGLFWENLTGQSLPDSGLVAKTPFREINTEYINLNGKNELLAISTWPLATGSSLN